jgi:hypothetical protein
MIRDLEFSQTSYTITPLGADQSVLMFTEERMYSWTTLELIKKYS